MTTAVRECPNHRLAALALVAALMLPPRSVNVSLGDLWPAARVRELAERIDAAPAPAGVLEAALVPLAGPPPRWVAEVVSRVRSGVPIHAIAAAVALSERQRHRRSKAVFGYGAKTLARILRLQRALELARSGEAFAEVAARTGYADQAHLSREARDLAGVPLTRLVVPRTG